MSDHTLYDEAFFAEQERPSLRKQVNECIDRLWATTGKSHSLLWRKAYLALEEMTSFRVPEQKGLDAVQKAGLMEQLLVVVRSLTDASCDHAGHVHKAIPNFVPYESDRERWAAKGSGKKNTHTV